MHFATCLEGCQSASRAARQAGWESYHHLAAPPLPPPAPSQAQSCLGIQICPRPPLLVSRTICWRRRLVLRWGRRPRLGEASGAGGSCCFSAASTANHCNCDTWRSGLSLPARFDIWQRFYTTFNPKRIWVLEDFGLDKNTKAKQHIIFMQVLMDIQKRQRARKAASNMIFLPRRLTQSKSVCQKSTFLWTIWTQSLSVYENENRNRKCNIAVKQRAR